jgi:probable HAF family extracellular repeat protein
MTLQYGQLVLRGNPSTSSPPPPAGLGSIMAGAFTSPEGRWLVGTAFASPVGQSHWRGYVQPVYGAYGAGAYIASVYGPPGAYGLSGHVFNPTTNLDDAFTAAFAVNDSAVAVGAASLSSNWDVQAVRFNSDGTTTMLGTTGTALGISNSGLIVGTTTGAVGVHGFLYDSGTLLDLNQFVPPNLGLDIVTATDVFDDGQIVAFGIDVSGQYHKLLLTPDLNPTDPQPVPEPSTALVFGGIAVSAFALKRRIGRNAA